MVSFGNLISHLNRSPHRSLLPLAFPLAFLLAFLLAFPLACSLAFSLAFPLASSRAHRSYSFTTAYVLSPSTGSGSFHAASPLCFAESNLRGSAVVAFELSASCVNIEATTPLLWHMLSSSSFHTKHAPLHFFSSSWLADSVESSCEPRTSAVAPFQHFNILFTARTITLSPSSNVITKLFFAGWKQQ